MRKVVRLFCLFFMLAVVIASYIPAHVAVAADVASITGTIKNTSGNAIPKARVWLGYRCYDWDNDTYSGFVKETNTNSSGAFTFSNLDCPGNWNFAEAVIRVFVTGYESTVLYDDTFAAQENINLGVINLSPKNSSVLKWSGLRQSSYAVFGYTEPGNWPDGINPYDKNKVNEYKNADGLKLLPWEPNWEGYYPNTFQWAGGMQYMTQGTSAAPASLWTVGKIIYDLRDGFGKSNANPSDPDETKYKSELWFQFTGPGGQEELHDGWIHYRTQAPTFKSLKAKEPEGWFRLDQVERVEFMCDHSPNLNLYLAVEAGKNVDKPGQKTMKDLMEIVFNKFGHISCVKGFAVDGEFYQGGGDDDNLEITKALAQKWEQNLIEVAGPQYRLMLKHFNLDKLPSNGKGVNYYFGSVIYVNSSQSYDTYDRFLTQSDKGNKALGVRPWANKFIISDATYNTFADVGYQFGYSGWDAHKDYGWWKNLASTTQGAPHYIRNGIVGQNGIVNKGQGVAALWVDMNLWIAMPDTFGFGPTPCPILWTPGEVYNVGDQVLYGAFWYEAIQAHTSQVGWEPPKVPALWQKLPSGSTAWEPNVAYAVGAEVTYNGKTYKCLQAHTSLVGWEPPKVPALWKLK